MKQTAVRFEADTGFRAGENLKKQSKKVVLGTFLKILTKKLRFSARAPPSIIEYIGAKGAFRKILGSVGQKWIFLKVPKGEPFGSAGGRIPKGGRPPPPPKSAPGNNWRLVDKNFELVMGYGIGFKMNAVVCI